MNFLLFAAIFLSAVGNVKEKVTKIPVDTLRESFQKNPIIFHNILLLINGQKRSRMERFLFRFSWNPTILNFTRRISREKMFLVPLREDQLMSKPRIPFNLEWKIPFFFSPSLTLTQWSFCLRHKRKAEKFPLPSEVSVDYWVLFSPTTLLPPSLQHQGFVLF